MDLYFPKSIRYGFAVTVHIRPNMPTTWYGTYADALKVWTDEDFHPERLGRKRGWDPSGTFIYDAISHFVHNNTHYPATKAMRRDFCDRTVYVTEATQIGDGPWESPSYSDIPARRVMPVGLETVYDDKYMVQLRLYKAVDAFVAYAGSAAKYQEVEKALLDFQEVTHEYDRQRLTLQESQAIRSEEHTSEL